MKIQQTNSKHVCLPFKVLVCAICILLFLSACSSAEGENGDGKATAPPTASAHSPAGSTQTPASPTGKQPPSSFEKGTPFAEDTENVEIIFSADFENTGFDCDGEASAMHNGVTYRVIDGILKCNIDDDGKRVMEWDTWVPNTEYYFDDYAQIELSCDLASFVTETTSAIGNHVGALWGCYVKDYLMTNASYAYDGIWFNFCASQPILGLYGLSLSKWGDPFTTVPLPETLEEMKHVTIDCTDEGIVSVSLTLSTGEQKLVCRVVMETDKVTVFDMDGQQTYRSEYIVDEENFDGNTILDSAQFVFFPHLGAADLDNVVIKGLKK